MVSGITFILAESHLIKWLWNIIIQLLNVYRNCVPVMFFLLQFQGLYIFIWRTCVTCSSTLSETEVCNNQCMCTVHTKWMKVSPHMLWVGNAWCSLIWEYTRNTRTPYHCTCTADMEEWVSQTDVSIGGWYLAFYFMKTRITPHSNNSSLWYIFMSVVLLCTYRSMQ